MFPAESMPTSRGSLNLPEPVPYPPTDQSIAPVAGSYFSILLLPVSATTTVEPTTEYSSPDGYMVACPGPPIVRTYAGTTPVSAHAAAPTSGAVVSAPARI